MFRSKTLKKNYIKIPILILIYLGIGQLLSMLVGSSLLLPSPLLTAKSLLRILTDASCWTDIGNTFLRLFFGYAIGCLVGIGTAVLTARFAWARFLLSPLRLLVKTTPVMSFVLILLVSVISNLVPVVVSAIMVIPLLWATTEEAILSLDPKLDEMGEIFFSPFRRTFLIQIPQILPQVTASAVTALGFAWKAVITAEVLSLPRFAIGNRMYLSKLYLEYADMFAWTFLVVSLAVCMEIAVKRVTQSGRRKHDTDR